MRIMYFPKLIKQEETKPHCLKNCNVVIDGNNFFYNSYEDSKLPFVFGSEANEHARYLRNILTKFKQANVTCYFVFKGGCSDMKKKLQNTKPYEFDIESNMHFVSPVFLKDVCKQVLQEAGVKYATCDVESKDHCVALAKQLGCAVLSNDIEYCFKEAPYIPITTLKYKKDAITCGQYDIEEFLHKHKLTNKKFAIFAVLSDVKVFPQNHFSALFTTWGVQDMNLYGQYKKLLQWLSEHSANDVINRVLAYLTDKNESKRFLNEISNISTNINHFNIGIIPEYLYNGCKLNISQSDPLWFEKGIATQNIAIPYIDLYKHRYIQGSSAIEKKGSVDSLVLSIDIIKYAYNLLTNFNGSEFSIYSHGRNHIKVSSDLNFKKPAYDAAKSPFQNGWTDIKRLRLFEHFLIENNMNLTTINKLPGEAAMLVIALTYFARHKASAGVDVTKQVYSFIVCHVILHVVHDRQESMRKKKSGINEADSDEARRATEQYFKLAHDEVKQIYSPEELKTMVEAQYCLAHMNYLNTLCGAPYRPTTYHRSFNGTFVYKLFRAMSDRRADECIETLFQRAPTVYKYIKMLITIYKELV